MGASHLLAGVATCRTRLTEAQRSRVVIMLLRHSGVDQHQNSEEEPKKKVHWAAKDPAVRAACCECLGLVGRENMLANEEQANIVISALVKMSKNNERVKPTAASNRSGSGSSKSDTGTSSSSSTSEDADTSVSSTASSIVEGAVISIGKICEQYSTTRERACEELIKIATSNNSSEDIHFACGETLAKIGLVATVVTTTVASSENKGAMDIDATSTDTDTAAAVGGAYSKIEKLKFS